MTTYFTSDLHFWHKNILKFSPKHRPFDNIEEMNEALIKEWNKTVKPTDTVYHLGDFCFKGAEATLKIISRLNGTIHWIEGNHDKVITQNAEIASIPYKQIVINKQKIVLCHYPIASWNGMHRGYWMLHGHCHGSYQGEGKILDVGWDNLGKLVSFEELKEFMDKREITHEGHH